MVRIRLPFALQQANLASYTVTFAMVGSIKNVMGTTKTGRQPSPLMSTSAILVCCTLGSVDPKQLLYPSSFCERGWRI
jgi:hypothetical protein